jgi:hypothetical protein
MISLASKLLSIISKRGWNITSRKGKRMNVIIEDKKFGKYLVDTHIIKRHDLVIALEKQKLFGGMLGENLCDIGSINPSELRSHLSEFNYHR